MKRSVRIITFAALAASCLCGKLAYGSGRPVLGADFGLPLHDSKVALGGDGILRVLFDFNPAESPAPSTYSGSSFFLIDPNHTIVGASNPTVPGSVGAAFDLGITRFERSNIGLFAQADGNTTLIFYFGFVSGAKATNSFGVWTYNSSGNLISGVKYGPFTNTRLSNLYFDASGKIIAKWQIGSIPFSYAAWVLDEFGTAINATSFFGPFGQAVELGKVTLNSANQQVWSWRFDEASGAFEYAFWTFDPTGATVTNSQVFGPF
jgi:hypothetical protein